jgi:hypothetical protein
MRKLAAALLTAGMAGGLLGLTPAVAGAQTDNAAFCDAVLNTQKVFDQDEPAQADVEAVLTELQATTVPELSGVVEALIGALSAGGDPTENPAFSESLATIGEYVFTNCGWQTAEVDMSEYTFTGLPKSFTTGPVAIKLTNSGAEVHEFQVVRIKNSKDKLKAIVNLPEKKARKKVEAGGAGFAVPGETGYAFLDFAKSGNYGAVCFVPVGSTPDQEEGGDGPPHAHEGMIKSFKVTKAAS